VLDSALAQVEHCVGVRADDLGTRFAEGMRSWASSASALDLSPLGRRLILDEFRRALTTRARLSAAVVDRPRARRVVLVTGLPRTGSTFVHHLLAQVPNWWAPTLREMTEPLGGLEVEQNAANRVGFLARAAPEFVRRHPVGPLWPEECITLLLATGYSALPLMFFDLPDYACTLRTADWEALYREYLSFLDVLAPAWADTIVLKSPFHLPNLSAFRAASPDSFIIRLSRDFESCLRSWTSLVLAARTPFVRHSIVESAVQDEWTDFWRSALRSAVGDAHSFHIPYGDLERDPIGCLTSAVSAATGSRNETPVTAWAEWIRDHPKDQFGHVAV